jgi:hypothetical protein
MVMAMYEMEAARYGFPNEELGGMFGFEDKDATQTKLSGLDLSDPYRLLVWYDMGDDWRVVCTLEEVLADPLQQHELPPILKGKGLGIIEDCGGIYALADLAEAFKIKQGEEYEEYKEWLGINDLDLTAFDIDDINLRIKRLPDIYARIYEQFIMPSEEEINFIRRRYRKNNRAGDSNANL